MGNGRNKEAAARRGILLFSFGTFVGLALALFMVWGDLEAALFDPSLSSVKAMGIRCPVLMGRDDRVTVSASFHNPLEWTARYRVRTHISAGLVTLMRQLDDLLSLAPGERQRLEWEVTSEDAAYGLFALVKVHRFGFYPIPAQQGSCGIVLVDLPLPGGVMFGIALALMLLGMGGGYALWLRADLPMNESTLDASRAMPTLAVLVVLGLLAGLVNIWILGIVVLVISLLVVVVLLGHRVEKRAK